MDFIADTDTDENYFGINFPKQMQTQLLFAVLRGPHSRLNYFEHNFRFHSSNLDTEKYYFRIISAMNSDKR